MNIPPKKMYPLFQPLKLRPTSDVGAKKKDDDDDDIPLSALTKAKKQNVTRSDHSNSKKRTRLKTSGKEEDNKFRKLNSAHTNSLQRSTTQETLSFQKIEDSIEPQNQIQDESNIQNINDSSIQIVPENTNNNTLPISAEKEPSNTEHENQAQFEDKSRKKSLRRIISRQSSIEFIPEKVKAWSSRSNILSHLVRRSTCGSRLTSALGVCKPNKWKCPSWVSLEQLLSGPSSQKTIVQLAWDNMGVLLAVASADKWISVYDFDMIRAADMHGRNDRMRQNKDTKFRVPPALTFRVPFPVAVLQWNPHNLDQLIVGFKVSGQVHLYNVDRISLWQSRNQRHQLMVPPKSSYIQLSYPKITGTVSSVQFLNAKTVFVSLGTMVYCWKLQKDMTSLIWRYQPPASVTCSSPFGSTFIMIGTKRGHLSLLNWKKYTREGAFTSENRPIVVHEWIPHTKLKISSKEQRLQMGIVNLKVEATLENKGRDEPWGRCEVFWVTTGGWLLSTILESATIQDIPTIYHKTPLVKYLNADGDSTQTQKEEWSQPQDPVFACMDTRLICWPEVPAVTKVLPHHNKYVLDPQRRIIRSKKRSLLYRNSGIINSISLPCKGMPQTVAFHPDLEWIVMGVGQKLVLLVARG